MTEAYESAAQRHFADAEQLASAGRFDNAGHLVGFAAECAIKHHFGLTSLTDSPKKHLPAIAAIVRKRFSSRDPKQAAMAGLLAGFGDAFFADWDVNHRYNETGFVTSTQYGRWREQARRTMGAAGFRAETSGGAR